MFFLRKVYRRKQGLHQANMRRGFAFWTKERHYPLCAQAGYDILEAVHRASEEEYHDEH